MTVNHTQGTTVNSSVAMAGAGFVMLLFGVITTVLSVAVSNSMNSTTIAIPVGMLCGGGSVMLKGMAGCMSEIEEWLTDNVGVGGMAVVGTLFVSSFLILALGGMFFARHSHDEARLARRNAAIAAATR